MPRMRGNTGRNPMPANVCRPAIAATTLLAAAILVAASSPAAALRACTTAEMRRISESFIIDCFAHHRATVRCNANGDPVCCYTVLSAPSFRKCTTDPGADRLDPRPRTWPRPPRAGMPDGPPRPVGPYTPVPPRVDPPPGRVGPPSGPTGPIIRSGK
jgi:hypothetical protein